MKQAWPKYAVRERSTAATIGTKSNRAAMKTHFIRGYLRSPEPVKSVIVEHLMSVRSLPRNSVAAEVPRLVPLRSAN
jgi:hypothetical protein